MRSIFYFLTSSPFLVMMNNKKRSVPGSAVVPNPSKKRKTDNIPKFYAVKAGFKPGVYATYAECQKQTAGFKGAVCKS